MSPFAQHFLWVSQVRGFTELGNAFYFPLSQRIEEKTETNDVLL
jgi:hypothetical protein